MDVYSEDVPVGRFFAVVGDQRDGIFMMCVRPNLLGEHGLCQNIADNSMWLIQRGRRVRLIPEDEHEQRVFYD
jgi:hypothetical protein